MRVDVSVEPITAQHIDSFHRALEIVAREQRFLTLFETPPFEDTRDYLLTGFREGTIRFVATTAAEVVGWCDISRHAHPSHAHRGTVGMGLVPGYRGRGIGRAMLEAALARAWDSRLTRIELAVHADNAPAIALYERVGFEREGMTRRASLIDGYYRDAILMAMLREGVEARSPPQTA